MARHLTPRGLVAEARRLGQCGIDRPVLHAPGHVQPADRPTDEWVRSAEHELAVAEVGRELEQAGVRGVHFRAPTVDGRLIGKFVHLRELGHAARHGIRLHPSALTDARADRHGALLAFEERAPELVALPDLSTLRRLPWEPRVAQVLCGVDDPTTGAPAGHCARATLARMNDAFMAETGLAMRVGVEPEVIWVRRRPDGTLEPVAHTISFYDASAMLDFEPVLLDLVDVCDGLGIEVTEASSEGATQLEVNHRPSDPLAAADAVTLFRLACGAVARRRGLIATFMPKPWAGESGSGHHHNLSLHDAEGRTRSAGDLKGRCRLSAEGTHLLAGLLEHIDALTVLGAPSVNSYKRFADAGQWAPTVKRFGFDDRTCVLRGRTRAASRLAMSTRPRIRTSRSPGSSPPRSTACAAGSTRGRRPRSCATRRPRGSRRRSSRRSRRSTRTPSSRPRSRSRCAGRSSRSGATSSTATPPRCPRGSSTSTSNAGRERGRLADRGGGSRHRRDPWRGARRPLLSKIRTPRRSQLGGGRKGGGVSHRRAKRNVPRALGLGTRAARAGTHQTRPRRAAPSRRHNRRDDASFTASGRLRDQQAPPPAARCFSRRRGSPTAPATVAKRPLSESALCLTVGARGGPPCAPRRRCSSVAL